MPCWKLRLSRLVRPRRGCGRPEYFVHVGGPAVDGRGVARVQAKCAGEDGGASIADSDGITLLRAEPEARVEHLGGLCVEELARPAPDGPLTVRSRVEDAIEKSLALEHVRLLK